MPRPPVSGRVARPAAVALLALGLACGPTEESLEVTATAFNSVRGQTLGDPSRTAWGHRLEPGVKAIAVSRDLIPLGLTDGVQVRIEGLPGRYFVLDKLHRRFKKRVDIYMGRDVQAARDWGKRRVTIRWTPPPDAS